MTKKRFTCINGLPDKNPDIMVGWDALELGVWPQCLGTDGVGPCLAITLYDTMTRQGALAHISGCQFSEVPQDVYPTKVVGTLISKLAQREDIDYRRLEATLSGESSRCHDENISNIVREELEKRGIGIVGEDLGDVPKGRIVYLDCGSGNITVYRP